MLSVSNSTSTLFREDLETLRIMIARRKPLVDVKGPSQKELRI